MASSPKLVVGRDIPSQIEGAIKLASVHIAIFYTNYAQSRWCLDELESMVKPMAPIIPVFYSMVKPRAPIIPVFYKVKPHLLPRFVDLGG